jgi:hypothetical protein
MTSDGNIAANPANALARYRLPNTHDLKVQAPFFSALGKNSCWPSIL